MDESVLASFALLNVSWDERGTSYIDNFVPMVADCLSRSASDVVSATDLQASLEADYHLHLPIAALQSIVKRAGKEGLLERRAGVLHLNRSALKAHDLTPKRDDTKRQLEALLDRFIAFAKDAGTALDREAAEKLLLEFIAERSLPILRTIVRGERFQPPLSASGTDDYIVSSFIAYVFERDPSSFDYIETIVKGTMLATALYLPDSGSGSREMSEVTIYLDTPFLLSCLGWDESAGTAAALELLALLRTLGARVACFDHTADEVRNVLYRCVHNLQMARRTRDRANTMPIVEHCLANGIGSSEVDRRIESLDIDLQKLGVNIKDAPDVAIEVSVDETKLEKLLQDTVHYVNPEARLFDLKSLTAVWRIRRGRRQRNLDSAGAIFATPNVSLVIASRTFFGEHPNGRDIPVCALDHELATVVWLRNPIASPDLPRKQLLADAYAAMLPREDLWNRFLDEVDRLQADETISEADYYVLRFTVEARRALMRETRGDENAFTAGTVAEVLRRSQEERQRELLAEIRSQNADLAEEQARRLAEEEMRLNTERELEQAKRSSVDAASQRQHTLDQRRTETAERWASWVANALFVAAVLVVLGLVLASLPLGLPFELRGLPRLPALVVGVVLIGWVVLSVLNLAVGTSLKSVRDALHRKLTSFFLAQLPTIEDSEP